MTTEADVFVITGAASGIGRRLAEHYASAAGGQRRLVVCDVDADALAQAAQAAGWPQERVVCERLDVRDAARWGAVLDAAMTRWGRLDVVMNVAGVLRPGYCWEATPEDVDLHFDINVKGCVHGTSAAARIMKARGWGHIVNVGSLSALVPVPGLTLYSASKFAVRGYSLAAAQELAPYGVTVTVIQPDAVQTPMLDLQVDYDQAALTFSGAKPLTVDDVLAAVDKALQTKSMEVVMPPGRGALARLATAAPQWATKLAPTFIRKGRAKQEAIKRSRPS